MASTVAIQAPYSDNLLRKFVRLLPGLFLLTAVGWAGKFVEQSITRYGKTHHVTLPNIEYVLWAILIGLVIANTVGIPDLFRPGLATYEFWLKTGIVLLGSRFVLGDVVKLGGVALALVVIEIAVSLAFMTWLGQAFGLTPKLTSLLAIGSSICGVSAIIAAQGAIDADEEDSSFAISAVLALGAIALFVFPLIGHWLGMGDTSYGLWAGLGVDNTAEATAAGALYSDAAGKVAVLAKTARNAMIGFVVLGYAIHWARKEHTGGVGNKAAFLWQKFPKFVLGFLLISSLASVNFFTGPQIGTLANLSRWAFLLTFAGVGLRTNIGEMRKQGLRPFLVGAIGEVVVAGLTLGLVLGANRFIH
jgi:uncharacterized integral membrane protein (TIGR00698 family)